MEEIFRLQAAGYRVSKDYMNRKPGGPLPAVLRYDENRVAGKRNGFIANLNDADINTVLRPNDNLPAFSLPAGENHLCKDFRRYFADFRHFRTLCGLFFLFFHDGSFDKVVSFEL